MLTVGAHGAIPFETAKSLRPAKHRPLSADPQPYRNYHAAVGPLLNGRLRVRSAPQRALSNYSTRSAAIHPLWHVPVPFAMSGRPLLAHNCLPGVGSSVHPLPNVRLLGVCALQLMFKPVADVPEPGAAGRRHIHRPSQATPYPARGGQPRAQRAAQQPLAR